ARWIGTGRRSFASTLAGSGEHGEEEALGRVVKNPGPLDQLLPPLGRVARDGGIQQARQRLEAQPPPVVGKLPELVVPAVAGVLDELAAGREAVVVHAQALAAVAVDDLVGAGP